MAKRKIITIDLEKCTGCGECIPNCPEGAIQIIDGKARLVSDLFCDGLGACLGHCPEGAITVIEREAEPYDEARVMENIVKQGPNVIKAHLEHLRDHQEHEYLRAALDFLQARGLANPLKQEGRCQSLGTCQGSRAVDFGKAPSAGQSEDGAKESGADAAAGHGSELRHWPIQLHLISPTASYYQGADVLLSADCVAPSLGNFHAAFLKGKSLAIACPKLDQQLDVYQQKIQAWIEQAQINTLTVMTMQVPCCLGLLNLARQAAQNSKRKVPIKSIVVSIRGEILQQEWL